MRQFCQMQPWELGGAVVEGGIFLSMPGFLQSVYCSSFPPLPHMSLNLDCFAFQIEVVPSASALIIKALKEPPRDRKKQKNSECPVVVVCLGGELQLGSYKDGSRTMVCFAKIQDRVIKKIKILRIRRSFRGIVLVPSIMLIKNLVCMRVDGKFGKLQCQKS